MKRTKKLDAAEIIAFKIGVEIDDNIYQNLEQNNYFWDSKLGTWNQRDKADPPTNLIKIKLWGNAGTIQEDCDEIISDLDPWFILQEQSQPYRCRPPKQLEARIYLTFLRSE